MSTVTTTRPLAVTIAALLIGALMVWRFAVHLPELFSGALSLSEGAAEVIALAFWIAVVWGLFGLERWAWWVAIIGGGALAAASLAAVIFLDDIQRLAPEINGRELLSAASWVGFLSGASWVLLILPQSRKGFAARR